MDSELANILEYYTDYSDEQTIEDRIRAIDNRVRKKASLIAIVLGVIGLLIMGTGMSLSLIPTNFFITGVVLGVVGLIVIAVAYPVYRKVLRDGRSKVKNEIRELAHQL